MHWQWTERELFWPRNNLNIIYSWCSLCLQCHRQDNQPCLSPPALALLWLRRTWVLCLLFLLNLCLIHRPSSGIMLRRCCSHIWKGLSNITYFLRCPHPTTRKQEPDGVLTSGCATRALAFPWTCRTEGSSYHQPRWAGVEYCGTERHSISAPLTIKSTRCIWLYYICECRNHHPDIFWENAFKDSGSHAAFSASLPFPLRAPIRTETLAP